jgi:hypothetical protein
MSDMEHLHILIGRQTTSVTSAIILVEYEDGERIGFFGFDAKEEIIGLHGSIIGY